MKYNFKELVDIPALQALTDELYKATSIPSAIIDIHGEILTGSGWQRICTDFHRKHPDIEKECIESDISIREGLEKGDSYVIYKCPRGLVDASSPVIIEGEHVANVFAGQLFMEPPDDKTEQFFREQAKKYGLNEEKYIEAYREIPVYPEKQFRYALSFLSKLAQMVATIGLTRLNEKKAAEELIQSQEKHSKYIENAPYAIFVADSNGRYIDVNEAGCRMTGYSRNELLGMSIPQISSPDALPEELESFGKLKQTGKVKTEVLLRRKDGSDFYASLEAAALTENSYIAFCLDISKRKKAEIELQDVLRLNKAVIDNAQDGIILYDSDLRYQMWNPFMEEISGKKAEDVIGKHPLEAFPFLKDVGVIDRLEQVLQGKETVNLDFPYTTAKTGRSGWTSDSNSPIYDSDGKIVGIVGIVRDITERKKAEVAIKHREEEYQNLFNSMSEGFALCEVICDKKGNPIDYRLLSINPAFGEQSGMDIKASLGKTIKEIYPDIESTWIERYGRVATTQEPIEFEDYNHNTGKYYNARAFSPEKGKFAMIFKDITERRIAEEALKESEEKFRKLSESSPMGVFQTDASGRVLYINDKWCSLAGIDREKAMGFGWVSALHPEDKPKVLDDWDKCLKEKTGYSGEFRLVRPDGVICIVYTQTTPIFSDTGDIIGHVGVNEDITERKKSEESLKKSETHLSNALRIAKMGHWEYDVKKNQFTFTDEFYSIFRTSAEEMGGYNISPEKYSKLFVHLDDLWMVVDETRKAIETTDRNYSRLLEHKMIYADGSIGYLAVRIRIIKDDEGNTIKTYGVNQDITERKKAEEKLIESEEKFRTLFERESDAIFIYNPDTTNILEANEATSKMYGYNYHELIGMSCLNFSIEVEKSKSALEKIRKDDEVKVPYRLHRKKDGTVFPVEISGYAITIGGKNVMFAVIKDITEQKKAEEAVQESEEKYRSLVETSVDIIWEVNQEGKFTYVSPNVKDLWGYEQDEVIGKTPFDFMSAEEAERTSEVFQEKAKLAHSFRSFENINLHKDGYNVIMEISGTPILDSEGNLRGYRGMNHDITERKQAEISLAHSHDLMNYVIEHNRGAVAVHDKDLNYIYVSKRYLQDYKVKESDVIGKHHYEIFPDLPQKWRDVHQKALAGEISSAEDDPYYRDDGTVDWTRWECRPWYLPDNSIGGIIIYTEVITERKKAEDDKKKLEEQLQIRQRMDSLGTLAGGIAHDFNNILVGIMGSISMLNMDKDNLTESQKELLNDANQSCERAANLIQQFQTLSTGIARRKAVVDIHDISTEVFGLLKETTDRLIKKQVKFNKSEFYVTADSGELHQVLLNLATNSAQAIEERGAKDGDYIRVIAEDYEVTTGDTTGLPEGEYVHISFIDTGIGMTEDIMKKAFDPMFSTKDKGMKKGQGLGLAMVYNIVTQINGGHIWIDSKAGKGTTFHIYLPKASPDVEAESKMTNDIEGGTETILVVDDEPIVIKLTQNMLTDIGYTVLTASGGKEALKVYRKQKEEISAVILDLTMPQMSGKQVLHEISEINPDVKVIISSGHGDEYTKDGVLSKAKGNISKPFKMQDLAQAVRTALDS
ncbi:PAS domain S-box protein [candidate division KSB1 bacterium]